MGLQFGDGVAKPGAVLGRDIDGDLEGVGGAKELGGCEDAGYGD